MIANGEKILRLNTGNPAEETCPACPYSNGTGAYSLPGVRMDRQAAEEEYDIEYG